MLRRYFIKSSPESVGESKNTVTGFPRMVKQCETLLIRFEGSLRSHTDIPNPLVY